MFQALELQVCSWYHSGYELKVLIPLEVISHVTVLLCQVDKDCATYLVSLTFEIASC
jgi:hypothetical protein